MPSLETAWQDVDSSFERFCLTAGIGALEQMLCEDAEQLAGMPHSRGGGRVGHRWGRTKGKIVRNLRWFEVVRTTGHIADGKVRHYQVTLSVGFTMEEPR